ncbi:hypothetical protein IWQ60_004188 [Tieghemiomyces parasiticus]|uniref:G-protein coupled receptors family 2 profile 2 domain-containing protein n=1 Tax=Tieghemiomyces parasiticus TaxID=78921 RepID=A0A9W8AGM6_9FUNG|nr:hypothetical protein IWQ60_004188 [Tieghemiomyces parasiticus]
MIDTTFLVRVAAGFSIAGCIAVFYDLWSQRSPRSQSLWYTFLLCLLDLGDAGTKFAARQALDGDQTSSAMVVIDGNLTHTTTDINASPASFACQLQGFIIQWMTLAAALASSLVALNLAAAFLLDHQRSVIQRRQKFLLCSFLLTSFTVAMLPIAVRGSGGSIAYGDGDLWCWIAEDQTILRVILWLGPISLLGLFNITVFVLVAYIIRRTIRRKYAAFTANQHQRLAKYHSLYLRTITIQALLLSLAWGPTLVARYYQLATDGAMPYSMAAALAVLSPLRGFLHALAYFGQAFLNRPWRRTGVNPPIKGEEYRQRKAEHGHFFSPANLLSRTNVPDGTIELIHADPHLPQLLSSEYSQGSSTHGTIPSPRPFLEPRSHSEVGSRLDIVSSWMYKELSVNESRSRPSWNPVAPYDRPASAPLTASPLSPPRPPHCRMSCRRSGPDPIDDTAATCPERPHGLLTTQRHPSDLASPPALP